MTTISIIIPTYERSQFLDGAINTVLNQSYSNIEVIIVDDGSNSTYAKKTINHYDERVKLITHAENKGLSAARNTGIQQANGEYIAFLDDDDRWHEEKLERQLNAMQRTGAGIGSCLAASVDPDGKLLRCESHRPEGDLSDEILRENVIGTPSRVVLHRDVLEMDRPFDENLRTKQDWDLFIRLCQREKVAVVPDHLCIRTIHDSMSSDPEAARRDNWQIIEKHEFLLRSRGQFEAAEQAYHVRVGRAMMENELLSDARSEFYKALRRGPTPRTAALLALTYTTPSIFHSVLSLKRAVERRSTDCTVDIEP